MSTQEAALRSNNPCFGCTRRYSEPPLCLKGTAFKVAAASVVFDKEEQSQLQETMESLIGQKILDVNGQSIQLTKANWRILFDETIEKAASIKNAVKQREQFRVIYSR